MRHVVCALLCGLALFAATSGAQGGVARVWAVNDGEKVKLDDTASALAKGNSAWNGTNVRLFGARNEVIAFQAIVEADGKGLTLMKAELPEFDGPEGFKIANAEGADFNDYRGRRIEIFSEHYLDVKAPTCGQDGGWFWAPGAQPKEMLGWIPDALVPLSAKAGKGGLPIQIAARRNAALWVDVYIPRDAPAGKYSGVLTLTFGMAVERTLPVELEVLDFALPDETHTKTMVYFSRENLKDRYGDAKLEKAFRQMAHRHRFDLISGGDQLADMDSLRGYLDGTKYTEGEGYYGPGEGVGDNIFSIGTYGDTILGETKESWTKQSDLWAEWFEKNAPRVLYFLYITDEPKRDAYGWIKERASWIKGNPGPGKRLEVFVTKAPTDALDGAIDFWQGVPQAITPEMIRREHSKGRLVGFYNGYRPAAGAVVLDEVAIGFRTFPWICRRYGADEYFYWEATHWRQNGSGAEANKARDVFKDAVTFTQGTPDTAANGDGTFFYPGRDLLFPDEDRGIDGPISSIRMKNLRRGLEDCEYMYLADQKGKAAEADAVVRRMIPAALGEAKGDVAWPEDGSSWDSARRALARVISGK